MSEEQEQKSFTVTDKRSAARSAENEVPKGADEPKATAAEGKKTKGERLRERIFGRWTGEEKEEEDEFSAFDAAEPGASAQIDFASFILSLSSSVFIHLGEVPDPISQKKEKNLPLAKQSIDILDMLQNKTRGNLTMEEENLVSNILYDLRMRYIQEIRR